MIKDDKVEFVRTKDVQAIFGNISHVTACRRMKRVREVKGKEKGIPLTKQDIRDVFKF